MENANSQSSATQESTENLTEQVTAFQKIWMETASKLLQTAISMPDAAPPEVARQMRSGLFQGMAKSWDEFLRSPQFLESMKQWMDGLIMFRRMSNEFLTRTHHEMQGTAREDVDTLMLAVRHMEQRVLGRLEEIQGQINQLKETVNAPRTAPRPATRGAQRQAQGGKMSGQKQRKNSL